MIVIGNKNKKTKRTNNDRMQFCHFTCHILKYLPMLQNLMLKSKIKEAEDNEAGKHGIRAVSCLE